MKLKHPEYAVRAARYLQQRQISFHLDMVGGGELEGQLKGMVQKWQLEQ